MSDWDYILTVGRTVGVGGGGGGTTDSTTGEYTEPTGEGAGKLIKYEGDGDIQSFGDVRPRGASGAPVEGTHATGYLPDDQLGTLLTFEPDDELGVYHKLTGLRWDGIITDVREDGSFLARYL